MKTFRQYITERLAIEDNPNAYTPAAWTQPRSAADRAFERRQAQRYGAVMARTAAAALTRSQRKSSRKPFPWMGDSSKPGWWHPQRGWFTFSHVHFLTSQFHVTQIV
jgi:cytochrome P450